MEITRIFDILENAKKEFSSQKDVLVFKQNGSWIPYTVTYYYEASRKLSCGFLDMGLKKGDCVVTISNNRPEWNFVDMALNQIGVVHVPLYTTISESEYEYILNHCLPKLLIVSDLTLYEKVKPLALKVQSVKDIYTYNSVPNAMNWKEILDRGAAVETKYAKQLNEIKKSILPDDTATLIYTSGTTGMPKGVMLSHKNILSNISGIEQIVDFNQADRTLSFLPVSHIFERTINYYFQKTGVTIYYAESLASISDNLKEVKPTVFIAVPRVLERIYDRILEAGKALNGLKKYIFFRALNMGMHYKLHGANSRFYKWKLKLADKLIFSKWRQAVGGHIKLIIVGGAAMQPRLLRIFNAAGIPMIEGYGMSETSPVIAANNPLTREIKIGTVGPVLPGVQAKIADDGEIMVKGDTVMKGYYKDEKLTQEAFDVEGWLHTGDLGVFVEKKYLKITDRKKEIFKLSSGKYIAPQAIENKFKESLLIDQLVVVGENEKFASALISPNFQFLKNWGSGHGVESESNQELIQNPVVVSKFQREVKELNKQLGQTEQIKRFRLVPDEWTPQSGELSPTLKLKRKFVHQKYKETIDEIFSVRKSD